MPSRSARMLARALAGPFWAICGTVNFRVFRVGPQRLSGGRAADDVEKVVRHLIERADLVARRLKGGAQVGPRSAADISQEGEERAALAARQPQAGGFLEHLPARAQVLFQLRRADFPELDGERLDQAAVLDAHQHVHRFAQEQVADQDGRRGAR